MIYAWCLGLTAWLTSTAWLLAATRSKLDAAAEEIADLKIKVRILRSREYGTRTTK